MPKPNQRAASFIDVTLHQAARRDALALGIVPVEQEPEPMTLNDFLWTLFGILVVLIGVLAYIMPD
jgi:hypothetical protein